MKNLKSLPVKGNRQILPRPTESEMQLMRNSKPFPQVALFGPSSKSLSICYNNHKFYFISWEKLSPIVYLIVDVFTVINCRSIWVYDTVIMMSLYVLKEIDNKLDRCSAINEVREIICAMSFKDYERTILLFNEVYNRSECNFF
jgi:hypothetical protein